MIEITAIQVRHHQLPAITAAVLTIMAFGAGQAKASHVACGETITADTTLDSDLLNCPSNGIVIGADDITLDLNGHTVDGDGRPFKACPKREFCDFGLLNDEHDGLTIEHGSFRDFEIGVFIGRARDSRVIDIVSSLNPIFGFIVAESTRSLIRDSSANDNPAPEGDGIGVFSSDHVRILDSTFRHNGELGMHVADSTHISIKRNLLSRSPIAIIMEGGGKNEISRNRFVRNDEGILLLSNGNTIARNHIFGARGVGISLEDGHGNLIAGNEIGRRPNIGIRVTTFGEEQHLRDNVVRSNRVHGAGKYGMLIGLRDKRTLLKGNHVSRAGNDGIRVRNPATTLTGNRSTRNGDLGIAAVPGVTDGGGNEASGNDNRQQCTNVACG